MEFVFKEHAWLILLHGKASIKGEPPTANRNKVFSRTPHHASDAFLISNCFGRTQGVPKFEGTVVAEDTS